MSPLGPVAQYDFALQSLRRSLAQEKAAVMLLHEARNGQEPNTASSEAGTSTGSATRGSVIDILA